MNTRFYISRTVRRKLLVALWIAIALIIIIRVGVALASLLSKNEPFRLSRGSEQSLIIYGLIAVMALFQAGIWNVKYHWAHLASNYVACVLLLAAIWWFMMGGLVYSSLDNIIAMFFMCVASVWHLVERKPGSDSGRRGLKADEKRPGAREGSRLQIQELNDRR